MASLEIETLVEGCPNMGLGCFASDPDALGAMAFMDDSLVRANLSAIAVAANNAGASGIFLEEQTYIPVELKITGTFPSSESINGVGMVAKHVSGERVSISDVLDGTTPGDAMRTQLLAVHMLAGNRA